MELEALPYSTKRFVLLFEKGPLFYISYQVHLFFFLLFRNVDLLISNDLDTLLPNFIISKLKGSNLLYDSHEYFTEVPELVNRPVIQKTWKLLERFLFPRLSYIITVNDSIASLYEKEYHKKIQVVRNIPDMQTDTAFDSAAFRKKQGLPLDKKILILQGSGINIHRGAEEAVEAMEYVNGAVLLIAGSGDVIHTLKEMSRQEKLAGKIVFRDKMPFEQLMQFTRSADLGLTLDKDTNINYRFSLPNKIFDYIHAGIAVLASDLTEVKKIVQDYQVGDLVSKTDPVTIAKKINEMLGDENQLEHWKANARKAALELTWEQEQKKLHAITYELLR